MPDLETRITASLAAPVDPAVANFARSLAAETGAVAALFYGSNLRTGSLEGVLDFYLLLPGTNETKIWPQVSYHERDHHGTMLRAKVATMTLATFARAASGELTDTTIWARFVQPSALIWAADEAARAEVMATIKAACCTAARLAAALGPASGTAAEYWRALFQATYRAELRVEKPGRENDILAVNPAHFDGLLPLALEAAGIDPQLSDNQLAPQLSASDRATILRWWHRRRRMGKPLNLLRLAKTSTTFAGAARYAAWKIERHTGIAIAVKPRHERFPMLIAPAALRALLRHKRG
jgi:hypothetical protein